MCFFVEWVGFLFFRLEGIFCVLYLFGRFFVS